VSWIFTAILNWLGGGVLDRVLGHFEAKAKSETEQQRIRSVREQHAMSMQAMVVTAGMEHKAFWVPWLIATVPLAAWFGWGMLDTLANGALPDVATIPPGLEPWAQIAWQNLFYSGGGVAAASIVARSLARR
jgi:hypothetical protein